MSKAQEREAVFWKPDTNVKNFADGVKLLSKPISAFPHNQQWVNVNIAELPRKRLPVAMAVT